MTSGWRQQLEGCTVGLKVIIDEMQLFFMIQCKEHNNQWGHLAFKSEDRLRGMSEGNMGSSWALNNLTCAQIDVKT